MFRKFGVIVLITLLSAAPALAQTRSLEQTQKFVEGNPELKNWFDGTVKQLRSQLIVLAKAAEASEDPDAFGIAGDRKAGKKLADDELKQRCSAAAKGVAEYANSLERHLCALLAANRVQEYPFLQKRLLATPKIRIELLVKDDLARTAFVEPSKLETEGGTKRVKAQKISFSSRALMPNVFPKTMTHELVHALIQGRDNEENKKRDMANGGLPTNFMVDLATARLPIYRYRSQRYIDKELLGEGITELRAQQAMALLGQSRPGVSYQHAIGTASMLIGIDERFVAQWYAGCVTTEDFWNGIQEKLANLLASKKRFTDEEAQRVAFGIANSLLDERNPKLFSQFKGAHHDHSVVMHTLIRALIEAGVEVRPLMGRADLPANVAPLFFSGGKK